MNKKEKISFLPFHAINEFMRPDYREKVVHEIFDHNNMLPDDIRKTLDNGLKKTVNIPGFRNSSRAPTPIKIKYTLENIEKSPDLVKIALSAWVQLHPELCKEVYRMLENRNWKILPIDADRSKLPGFMTTWPEGEDFEKLFNSYQQTYPESQSDSDDVNLMVVWLSGRLPYQFIENLFSEEGESSDLIETLH
jgi:hypothetical protein